MKDEGTLPAVLGPLVAAERAAPPGPAHVRDEVRERLLLAHGNAPLALPTPTGIAQGATSAAASSMGVKLVVLAIVAAGSFGAGFWVGVDRPEVVVTSSPITELATAAPPPSTAPVASTVAAMPMPQLALDAAPAEDRAPTARRSRTVRSAAPAPEPEAPPPAARESRLLRSAWAAYEAASYDEALRAIEAHAAEFTTGFLSEERDALWVRVLVDMGQHDVARERAIAFETSYPDSLHAPAVRRAAARIPRQNGEQLDKE